MKHISDAMPRYVPLAMRASDDPRFRDWWDIVDEYLREQGEPDASLAEAWRLYSAGWCADAAMHEIADRRAALKSSTP